jgi:hypothetical protein
MPAAYRLPRRGGVLLRLLLRPLLLLLLEVDRPRPLLRLLLLLLLRLLLLVLLRLLLLLGLAALPRDPRLGGDWLRRPGGLRPCISRAAQQQQRRHGDSKI